MGQKISLCSSNYAKPSKANILNYVDDRRSSQVSSRPSTVQTSQDNALVPPDEKAYHRSHKGKKIMGKLADTKPSVRTNKTFKEDTSIESGTPSRIRTLETANPSQDYGAQLQIKSSGEAQPGKDPLAALKSQKAMKIRITWTYGGKQVYIMGSFTNWEYMIKMHKNVIGLTPVFEISMYVKQGRYHYYFIVDGQVRFAPDQPSTIHKNQQIVNFIEIDQYMIKKAEEARDHTKVKNMADCILATNENSWHLSENFERNCKERCKMSLEEQLEFSLEMKSDSDDCEACHLENDKNFNLKQHLSLFRNQENQNIKANANINQKDVCQQKHMKFFPSSSYMEKNILNQDPSSLGDLYIEQHIS